MSMYQTPLLPVKGRKLAESPERSTEFMVSCLEHCVALLLYRGLGMCDQWKNAERGLLMQRNAACLSLKSGDELTSSLAKSE